MAPQEAPRAKAVRDAFFDVERAQAAWPQGAAGRGSGREGEKAGCRRPVPEQRAVRGRRYDGAALWEERRCSVGSGEGAELDIASAWRGRRCKTRAGSRSCAGCAEDDKGRARQASVIGGRAEGKGICAEGRRFEGKDGDKDRGREVEFRRHVLHYTQQGHTRFVDRRFENREGHGRMDEITVKQVKR